MNRVSAPLLALGFSLAIASGQTQPLQLPPIAPGPFKPDWKSLTHYETPEWFRDAKFGIWAHWGPQCEPEDGDWYARNMYMQGSGQYKSHLARYGHPSTHGFKDIIHEWKAEHFDPDKLLKFYKENGAKYFMALANHHDNFDLYDSKYQPWNSVNVGPKEDLIGGWAKAARANGLRFAVSVHAARAWTWYEVAQGSDKNGPLAGVPYDGKLTKADGKGQWWEGLDPQELYEQNHRPGKVLNQDFDAKRGTSLPDSAYLEKFFKRTKQLWDDYHPDQIYFDDRVLPFYNIAEEVPLKLAAHFYNTRLDKDGHTEAVMNGKILDEMQRRAMVYDIERGKANAILPQPWQTDTCIGGWHYDRGIYDRKGYKSAASVVRMLADIVSKNGNLMLSVPLQRDGQPDDQEIVIVKEIGAWLKVNGEAIYATRPWKIYGEGPSTEFSEEGRHGGQTDVSKRPFTPEDIRFTQSKDGATLYAIALEIPKDGKVLVKSLAAGSPHWPGEIGSVRLVGGGDLKFTRDGSGLHVSLPANFEGRTALALAIRSDPDAAKTAAPASITVQADKPAHPVSPMLWGIFFEDINLAADGGLYPELVRNRSFEGEDALSNWTFTTAKKDTAAPALDDSKPLNAFNRQSLRVCPGAGLTLENPGYWGMNFVAGEKYRFQIAVRGEKGFRGKLRVDLCGASGDVLASGVLDLAAEDPANQPKLSNHDEGWRQYSLELVPAKPDACGKLKLALSGDGFAFLDMISLMPERTWKGHGLRGDLAEAIDAMKPAFLRFPGGCYVEGNVLADSYNWKHTIGDIASRTPQHNLWDYLSTNGLGYHEYLQLAEDLGAEPVFCVNVGMSHRESVPLDRMGAWVQDALDAIEYANGPVDSVWGALRAKNGHPAPFNLRYIEVGNENGGPDYAARWPLFVKAIKAKYPDITLIANYWLDAYPKNPAPEVVDEHYYDTPEGLMRRATQYDNYDRKGHKVFVGEYAVTKRAGYGNLRGAVGEAAFMTGLERNSDIVAMAAYAPLFTNVHHRTWSPDLINFDSAGWYGLPSYFVQQMFSRNTGDVTLPIEVKSAELPQGESSTGGIGVGTWNTSAEFKDITVTAPDGKVLFASDFDKHGLEGWKFVGPGQWSVKDGVLRQTAEKENARALIGDPSWKDYTVEMKARKISGLEGFLLLFHLQNETDRTGWNLGGWDNKYFALKLDDADTRKDGSIETGRWYDVKVETRDGHVRCWLDGKLIHDFQPPRLTTQAIYASATRATATGEIILKVVNTAATPVETAISLNGISDIAGNARAIVLTSENPTDENSLAEPRKVQPRTEELTLAGPKFTRSFPGNSVTVLRIATRK